MGQGNSTKKPSGVDRSASGVPKVKYNDFVWWSKEPGGRERCREEFESLPPNAQGKLLEAIARRIDGTSRSQDVERVDGDIWAFRIRNGNNQHRILFFHWGSTMVGLTAFYKNQRQLPKQDIERAKSRLSDWKSSRGDS